jgi:hypothetical protein
MITIGKIANADHGHEVPAQIVGQTILQHRLHDARSGQVEQGISIRFGPGGRLCADHRASASPVLDDERLGQGLCRLVAEAAAEKIAWSARRISDDDTESAGRDIAPGHRYRWASSVGQRLRVQQPRAANLACSSFTPSSFMLSVLRYRVRFDNIDADSAKSASVDGKDFPGEIIEMRRLAPSKAKIPPRGT